MKAKLVITGIIMSFGLTVLNDIAIGQEIESIAYGQEKESIAILSIDVKNISSDNTAMGNMVRLELEKTGIYEVLDKYDVADLTNSQGIDPNQTFGKTKLIQVGKLLKADKMLTGSCEKFGDKIIIILRLIDVKKEKIEKANVMEFLNQETELQTMVEITINNLLGIKNDQDLVDLLIDYNRIITSNKTRIKLNGPRMGAAVLTGNIGKRLQAPKEEGGYNMYPLTSSFGYQYEFQYLSSGDFQALVECFGAVNGLESGAFIPSFALINGFRFNKGGWEFGLGPVFRLTKTANGFYDENNQWHLQAGYNEPITAKIVERIDRRGTAKFSTSVIIAAGKTFKSGYLNMPVNIYWSPRKEGHLIGVSFGFNIAKSK